MVSCKNVKKSDFNGKKFVKAKLGKTLPYQIVRLLSIKGKTAHIAWKVGGYPVDAYINICYLLQNTNYYSVSVSTEVR